MTADHLGRYQLGQELPLCLVCTLSGVPDRPSSHPTAEVRHDDGTVAFFGRVAADGQGTVVGLFRGPLFLNHLFTVGRYTISYRWLASGAEERIELQTFDLIPGGHADGAIVAIHPVERPDRLSLVYQTDGGRLARGLNPR